MKKIAALFFALLFPTLAFAQNVTVLNPIAETSPSVVIGMIISSILSIIGSIALLMFVYGGILWLTAFGEAAKIDKARRVIVWSVAGIVIIGASYAIVYTVLLGVTSGSVSG